MSVTITGTFLNAVDSTPQTGRGYIEPAMAVLQNSGNGAAVLSGVGFDLDANGSFSVVVPATDDPTLTPQDFSYRLGIRLTSDTPRRMDDIYFEAPQALGTIDVADMVSLGTPVTPSMAAALDARIDALEGEAGMTTFSLPGTLTVVAGTSRFYNDSGSTRTLTSVRAAVGTAPTGAPVVVDVKMNGTSVFPTSTKPTIAAGANTGTSVPDTTNWATGDYLTVDVTDVGSTVAGSNLTVTVSYR